MKRHAVRSLAALLLTALMVFSAVPALADQGTGNFYMYVQTGNSGRLHLRALPTTESQSLGLFANGTQVLVESISNGWAFVQVCGQRGYMSMSCLTSASPQPVPTPSPTEDTTLYIQTGNTGRLHLREYASQNARSLGLFANGTSVRVMARTNTGWAYVQVNGMIGYMMLKYLSSAAPSPQPDIDPSAYTVMYVRTGNTGKLHLREYASQSARSLGLYPNGTQVYAASLGNGWSKVVVYGMTGYMMTRYLSSSGGGSPAPVPTYEPVPVPEGAVWTYISTGNSGKLHLRENMSTQSASLGLYPNGTQVAIIVNYGAWAYVNVAGRTGYMMTQFLKGTAPVPNPTSTTPPYSSATATVRQPNGSFVYLRSTDSSASLDNVICKVPSGTVVDVIAWGNLWTRVSYNGIQGYIVTNYLK